jgi:hypothetical protein
MDFDQRNEIRFLLNEGIWLDMIHGICSGQRWAHYRQREDWHDEEGPGRPSIYLFDPDANSRVPAARTFALNVFTW